MYYQLCMLGTRWALLGVSEKGDSGGGKYLVTVALWRCERPEVLCLIVNGVEARVIKTLAQHHLAGDATY